MWHGEARKGGERREKREERRGKARQGGDMKSKAGRGEGQLTSPKPLFMFGCYCS